MNDETTPALNGTADGPVGPHLFAGSTDGILEAAIRLLDARQRFVIVARTLPAAVRLREALAPTQVFDESGLPITHQVDGRVALFRAHAPAPRRRALLSEHVAGRIPGLVLTPDDLAAFGMLEAFAALSPVTWLVEDAHCASFASSSFVPAMRRLVEVQQRGIARAMWLFSACATAEVAADLRTLFQIPEAAVHASSISFPESVAIAFEQESEARFDREVLGAALRRRLAGKAGSRGVLVTTIREGSGPELPRSELVSVIEEVGAEAVVDPGEDADAQTERWAALLRRPAGIVLTENPEAIEIVPAGGPSLFLRLVAPESPEVVLDECLRLARQGGGEWVYLGPAGLEAGDELPLEVIERLGRWIAEAGADGKPVAFDAQELMRNLEIGGGLEGFGAALERALHALQGVDLLAEVRPVRFQLEVAESHRFASPHIDSDPRYVELARRYEDALAQMGMLQSIKYRLNAVPPKDLRVLARFLGYPIAELNALFDDLAREGIVICRQVVTGPAGNRSFEVVGQGTGEEMRARLPLALERIAAQRARAGAERDAVARLVEQRVETSQALMSELEGRVGLPAAGAGAAGFPGELVPRGDGPRAEGPRAEPPRAELRAETGRLLEAPARVGAEGETEGARTIVAPAPTARKLAAPLEQVVSMLTTGEPLEAAELPALIALAESIRGHSALPAVFTHLEARAAGSGPELRARTLQVLLLELAGDAEAAAQALLAWLQAGPDAALRDALLPLLVSGIDYHFESEGGPRLRDIPEAVIRLGLALPALEVLPPDEAARLVGETGFTGTVALGEFGATTVELEGRRYILRRQGAAPETEAELWLQLEAQESPAIPAALVRARLAETYLMLAGIAGEELGRRLAGRVLATIEQPAWMGSDRRALARGRALMAEAQPEAALEVLAVILHTPGLQQEVARVRAEAQLRLDLPLEALRTLSAAGVSPARGEGHALWLAVAEALNRVSEAHAACDSCPLLNTEFCPPGAGFWPILEHSPFGESRRALRHRLEKRARHGLNLDAPQRLLFLFERFGGRWEEGLLTRWLDEMEGGRTEDWLAVAQRLGDEGWSGLVLKAAERGLAVATEARHRLGVARVRLAAGDLAGALEILVQQEAAGEKGVDLLSFSRELELRFGRNWESRIETFAGELNETQGALLRRVAESSRARAALSQQRHRLEQAVRRGQWREMREALEAYRGLAGEAAEREPVVREVVSRLAERSRRVQQRIEQLTAGPAALSVRPELSRLSEEAEHLGLEALVTRAREALAAEPPAPVQPERGAPEGSRRARPEGARLEGARPEADRQGGRRDERGEPRSGQQPREQRREERRAGPARPDGERREERRTQERAKDGGPRRAGGQKPAGPLEEPILLQAVKEARGDRERVSLVMPAVYELLGSEPERGIKLLRDALPLFQFQGVLDRPMADVVREGRPEDGALPRLRRVLEKDHARFFTATLGELSTRENPEPWKRVLGQLKLKG